jgi:hypothetical protein
VTTSKASGPLRRIALSLRRVARRSEIRDALVLCVPALILAIVLRAYLTWHFPVAFIHDDSASLLETGHHLLDKAAFAIEGKKTLLVPAIYCIPALLGIPVLAFAAAVQHLVGVGLVLVVGLLVRAWFVRWRAFIIPVTGLVALHPALLWYEHVALAETFAVFAAVLLPLVGWVFYQRPRPATLAAFFAALFLVATARPEGNLFVLFGIALVAWVSWGKRKTFFLATGATCGWAAFLFAITQTSQGGTLLYASVVHLTPDRLFFSPGIAEAVRPVREASRAAWAAPEVPSLVSVRKSLREAIEAELVRRDIPERDARAQTDAVCKAAALETLLRNPLAVPPFVLKKFVIGHHEPLALGFNDYARSGQMSVLFDDGQPRKAVRFSQLAWGTPFATRDDAESFFARTTTPVPGDWLWGYLLSFQRAMLVPVFPLALPGADARGVELTGPPWLYALALLGMIALAARPPHPVNFHLLFGLFLVGFFTVILLTANVRARFRLVFEPFWFLYAAAWLDFLWVKLRPRTQQTNPNR